MNIDTIERSLAIDWRTWGKMGKELLEETPISYEAIINAQYSSNPVKQGEIYVGFRPGGRDEVTTYKIFYFPFKSCNLEYGGYTEIDAVFVTIQYDEILNRWYVKHPMHPTQTRRTTGRALERCLSSYSGWVSWSEISKSFNFINWTDNPFEVKS